MEEGRSPAGGRRLALATLVLALMAILAAPGILAAPAAQAQAGWPSWPGQTGGVFRTGAYTGAQWIYTNGIHQALGANSDLLHRTDYFRSFYPAPGDPTYDTRDIYNALTYDFFGSHRAAHNGDYQLPDDPVRWPEGTADLAELRLTVADGYLYVRLLWNSFPRPDAQIATLAFATQGAVVSQRPWPRNARLASPWQAALTLWGRGGALTGGSPAGGPLGPGLPGTETPVAVRIGDHTTEARIPLALLPPGPWSLTGGSGLQDPSSPGSYWQVPSGNATSTAPGSGGEVSPTNVWDLLFADDRPWSFDELHQADELLNGSAAAASAVVDPRLLERGAAVAAPPRTGDLSRMFLSTVFEGDGIRDEAGVGADTQPPAGFKPPIPSPGFDRTYLYTGRLQYYGMHVPDRYPASRGPWPLIVYLHGFTGLPDEAFYNPVGLVQEADRRGYLLATPLGRGDYFYRGEGDLDVLEVIRDVERHYRVDPSRIYLMGHSMGGYGTNNVAMHHPDLFAAVAPAEGTDSIELNANLRDLPWFEVSALEDLDTGAAQAKTLYGDLSAAGYDARLLVYTTKIHEYSSIYDTLPELFAFFAAHRRQLNPAVVSWTLPIGQDRPSLGLHYDGAYWLDDVHPAAPARGGSVTVTSQQLRHVVPNPARAVRTDQMVDTNGPTGRSKGELYTTTPATGPIARPANELDITASGITGLRVDASGARLRLGRPRLTLRVITNYRLTVRLSGIGSGRETLRVDGRRAGRVRTRGGILTLTVGRGRHTLVLQRAR